MKKSVIAAVALGLLAGAAGCSAGSTSAAVQATPVAVTASLTTAATTASAASTASAPAVTVTAAPAETSSSSAAALPAMPIGENNDPRYPVYAVVRPTGFASGAGAHMLIYAITWERWGSSGAAGHGLRPACSTTTTCSYNRKPIPTTLVLSAPVNGLFTRLDETFLTNGNGAPLHNVYTTSSDFPTLFDTSNGGTKVAVSVPHSTPAAPPSASSAPSSGSGYPCAAGENCNTISVMTATLSAYEMKAGIKVSKVTCRHIALHRFSCAITLRSDPNTAIPALVVVSADGHTWWVPSSG